MGEATEMEPSEQHSTINVYTIPLIITAPKLFSRERGSCNSIEVLNFITQRPGMYRELYMDCEFPSRRYFSDPYLSHTRLLVQP